MTALVPRVLDDVVEASVVGSFSRLGPAIRRRLFRWEDAPPGALAGRTAVVTGATSGIGLAIGAELAGLGAQVTLVGRDAAKLVAAEARVRAAHPAADVTTEQADLARLADVRALAAVLDSRLPKLDVLVHNAGALVHEHQRTDDDLELTLQVHVVAPFLLTTRLLAPLRAAREARVLTMSSGGMYTQRLDVEHLQSTPADFDGTVAYARAKRAQVELNAAWAQRFPEAGIGFHALHPGWVDTPGLHSGLPGFTRLGPLLRPIPEGADTAVWLAWTPEATAPGGDFWLDRARRGTVHLPWTRTPAGEADRLWQRVVGWAGVDPEAGA
jgi:NAD(P)-dependent dehydrogenase (short-subunit alcohol dehydrogenase family)